MTSSPGPTDRIVNVAVPVPGLGVLSYRAPGTALLHKGVIVRPVASYALPEWLRVSVGLPGENDRFLAALRESLGR